MNANVHIRVATSDDIASMQRIRISVRENQLSDSTLIDERSYEPYLSSGGAWVAESDVGIVGFAMVDADRKSVWALFVHPDAEGIGVGKALHERILEWSRERGFDRLSLTTTEGTRAERFYRRHGWAYAGRADNGEIRFNRVL